MLQGKLALAVDAYEKAQTAAPNFAIVHINLAIALTEMGTHAKMSGELSLGSNEQWAMGSAHPNSRTSL